MFAPKLTLASAALLAASLVTPAQAQDQWADDVVATAQRLEGNLITVSYADLNLANDNGVQRLTHRVRNAAKQVCGAAGQDIRPLPTVMISQRCYRDSMTRASDDIQVAVDHVRNGTQVASLRAIHVGVLASR